jgi:hypothetical protein
MSEDDNLVSSFVHGIEHGHILLDDENLSSESLVLTSDVAGRKSHGERLARMIHGVDVAVAQIDVEPPLETRNSA